MIFLFNSCARKVGYVTSSVVPAAQGKVKVKKDNNDNYAIDINVRHLAAPDHLPQPKNVYMVWRATESNCVQNLGQLNTSSSLISSTLKASMNAITPYKPKLLFITGADAGTVQAPGDYRVLTPSAL